MRACPSKSELTQFTLGQMREDDASRLLDHIDSCPSCSDAIDTLNLEPLPFLELLRQASTETVHELPASLLIALDKLRQTSHATLPFHQEPSPNEFSPETAKPILLGKYELLELIGRGGMGVVYRARHRTLGQIRALKVLSESLAVSQGAIARFAQEIVANGRLDNVHIVRALDADMGTDGVPYLVMEYVQGSDLDKLVRENGPLSPQDACEFIRQAAIGLSHIAKSGIVHSDIKPKNLMVTTEGTVKILDLGIANLRDPFESSDGSEGATVQGTLGYIAPEQVLNPKQVDTRADIYGLGASFYFLLTGLAPFHEQKHLSDSKRLSLTMFDEPTPILELRPELPQGIATLVSKMMARSVQERYQTPEDVEAATTAWLENRTRAVSLPSARRWIATTVLTATVLAACWLGFQNMRNPIQVSQTMGTAANSNERNAYSSQSLPAGFSSQFEAAKFVIESGGNVYIMSSGDSLSSLVRSVNDLPDHAFSIVGVKWHEICNISPRDLQKIVEVSPMLNTVQIAFHQQLLPEHIEALHGVQYLGDLLLGSIAESEVGDAEIASLLSHQPAAYSVLFHGISVDGSFVDRLADKGKLRSLKIGSVYPIPLEGRRPQLSPEWFQRLNRFPNLQTLSFPGIRITTDHVRGIRQLPGVTELLLSGAEGIPECIHEIAAIPKLTLLDINSHDVRDDTIEKLHDCKTLRTLELHNAPVSETAIRAFQKAVPQCRVISVLGDFEPVSN